MTLKLSWACGVVILAAATLLAQVQQDVLGSHDLSPSSSSPVHGIASQACLYCHAPHSGMGGITPLWDQQLSTAIYTTYDSSTYVEKGTQPTLGADSSLCLSCHDGTVAVGQTIAYHKIPISGSMKRFRCIRHGPAILASVQSCAADEGFSGPGGDPGVARQNR